MILCPLLMGDSTLKWDDQCRRTTERAAWKWNTCLLVSFYCCWFPPQFSQPLKRVGVGIQAAPFPIFGASARYIASQQFAIEVFGRPRFANTSFIALRGQYLLVHDSVENLRAAVLIGTFKDYESDFLRDNVTENALGYGAGFGYEHIVPWVRNLTWNAELNYILINFKDAWWIRLNKKDNFSLVMIGFGFHFYFWLVVQMPTRDW